MKLRNLSKDYGILKRKNNRESNGTDLIDAMIHNPEATVVVSFFIVIEFIVLSLNQSSLSFGYIDNSLCNVILFF